MNTKETLAERILLAIAPTIVQTEQFRAYEEVRSHFETKLKGKKEDELKTARAEFEAWRQAFVEGMVKETAIECSKLAYAIADEFMAAGGLLESALRKEGSTTLYGKNGPFIKQEPITVDMKDARI